MKRRVQAPLQELGTGDRGGSVPALKPHCRVRPGPAGSSCRRRKELSPGPGRPSPLRCPAPTGREQPSNRSPHLARTGRKPGSPPGRRDLRPRTTGWRRVRGPEPGTAPLGPASGLQGRPLPIKRVTRGSVASSTKNPASDSRKGRKVICGAADTKGLSVEDSPSVATSPLLLPDGVKDDH